MDYLLSSLYPFVQPAFDPQNFSEQVTQFFCRLIFACFLLGLIFGIWKRNALRFSQTTTTALGILGTFIGIYIGLIDFDTTDSDAIQRSVPTLLAGLKTAFLTSISGILAALLTRTFDSVFFPVFRRAAPGATVQTLADLLRQQAETDRENHRQTLESLESIRASVSGEGDTSMLTQVQKFRTTFSDKQDDLIREFRSFAEKIAEANSQKLIEALEEVMRDFNAKINEQFGDNFKQLNEAVKDLVGWQDKNKEQTERMIEQFDRTVSAIDQVRDSIAQTQASLAQMAERSEAITGAAEKLDPILTAIQEQRESLGNYMTQFAEMSEKAKELLPTLDAKISELTENFSESVRQSMDENRKSLDEQKEFTRTMIAGFSELDKAATDAIEKVTESSEQNIERMRTSVREVEEEQKKIASDLAAQLRSHTEQTFTKAEQEIARLAQRISQSIEAKVDEITESFAEAVRQTMDENRKSLDEQKELFQATVELAKRYIEHMRVSVSDAEGQQKKLVSDLTAQLDVQIRDTFTKTGQEITRLAQRNSQSIEERMRAIDEGLAEELEKALDALGDRLASISKRFAEDYTPLANALSDVMNIIRRQDGNAGR